MNVDEMIGKNLTRARGTMSQTELAQQMRDEGHRWSQTTVWKVEAGERPMRVAESISLAELFGVPIAFFIRPPMLSKLDADREALMSARSKLAAAAMGFRRAQEQAARALVDWERLNGLPENSVPELTELIEMTIEAAAARPDDEGFGYGYYDLRRQDS